MSLITRCPACGTLFKVVADQLKVSQGWVRCGQCAEVFDAQLHLQSLAASSALDIPASGFAAGTPTDIRLPNDPTEGSYEKDVVAALQRGDSLKAFVAADPLDASASAVARREEPLPLPANGRQAEQESADAPTAELNDVSFVRDARRQAYWRKPLVRAVLAMFAVGLLGLLGLQFAVQQRDALLAFEPRSKPWLQMLCQPFACELGAPRRIEAVVIDGSSFNKADGIGSYRLSFAIKNTSANVVAMPSLEISLTDNQDQAVVRKVVSPSQLGVSNGLLAANAEFSNTLIVQVQSGTPATRVSGYRLLAFYP